jgi:hypothetical protein
VTLEVQSWRHRIISNIEDGALRNVVVENGNRREVCTADLFSDRGGGGGVEGGAGRDTSA